VYLKAGVVFPSLVERRISSWNLCLIWFFLNFGAGTWTGSSNNKAMSNELSAQDLLPPEIGLTLLGFEKSEQRWLVRAEGRTRSDCPSCGTQSTARHSRYWRQLQDLPAQGKRVALRLRLSRWRCRNAECKQAVFRERLGEVALPWARRTGRVEEVQLLVGHRTGGRGAEFLLKRLAMAISDDTILRRLRPVKLLDMIVWHT
jgi:hypothetical protein